VRWSEGIGRSELPNIALYTITIDLITRRFAPRLTLFAITSLFAGFGELADDETFLNSAAQLFEGLEILLESQQEVQESMEAARDLFKVVKLESGKGRGGGGFHWVDGVLVKAMEEGKWLNLENVNFCPSSVLDRLNPLMEIGGSLVLTEGGGSDSTGARVIHPHPNFRLFLSMNADTGGEVSRAMRNRCIEVSLVGGFGSALPEAPEGNDLDIYDELANIGVGDLAVAERMLKVHRDEIASLHGAGDAGSRSLKPLLEMAHLYIDLVHRGEPSTDALNASWRACYGIIDSEATVSVTSTDDPTAKLPLLSVVPLSEVRRSEERSDDRVLRSTITNNLLLVASLLAIAYSNPFCDSLRSS